MAIVILKRRIDIKRNIIPINKVPIDTSVNGMEKYLVVLKVERTIIENKIPKPIKTFLESQEISVDVLTQYVL